MPYLGRRLLIHAELVPDVADARHEFHQVLDRALDLPRFDAACQRHFALAHGHFDVARIDVPVVGQAIGDFFTDAFIGSDRKSVV